MKNDKLDFLRVFIFKQKDGVTVDGRIVEIIGDKDFISKNKESLPELYRRKHIPGFNGVIFGYDMDYKYLDGYNFKDGKRTMEPAYIRTRTPSSKDDPAKGRITSTLRVQDEDEVECWDRYWDTYTYGCGCWTSSEYLYTYCIVNDNGGGGDFDPDWVPPGGAGGGSSSNTTSPSDFSAYVTNLLTTPCFNMIWNTIASATFNNIVQEILYEFNSSANLAFVLKEQSLTGNSQTGQAVLKANGTYEVTLNSWALRDASQEAILATIFHEVLHVYINSTAQYDHQVMALKYTAMIAAAIEYWFPDINASSSGNPSYSSKALAWIGLHGTDAWKDLGVISSNYQTTYNKFIFRNTQNIREYGQDCP